jgi:WhiB family redox-sensing transcriptional regulator
MVGRKALSDHSFFVDFPLFNQPKCADVEDKDFFFPDKRTEEAERLPQLKAICSSCIHEKECLEYALEKHIAYGIWGGSTPAERDARSNGKPYVIKGMALAIVQLHQQKRSVNEIATQLSTSISYVKRVLQRYEATEQGAKPLHQQTKDSLNDWHSS